MKTGPANEQSGMRHSAKEEPRQRYPATRTSPWFFAVLATVTTIFILAGIFGIDPLTRFVRWVAVVL